MMRNILMLFCVTVLMLLGAEVALRTVNFPKRPAVGWRWENSPYKGEKISQLPVNQLQLRGRPIQYRDEDVVVVLVGDSQVEAGAQAANAMPEVLLERILQNEHGLKNVKVFSVASAGWGQDQQVLALKEYLARFRADMIIAWLSPSNDYWENTFVDRRVTREAGRLKPTFAMTGAKAVQGFPAAQQLKLAELVQFALGRMQNGQSYTLEHFYAEQWDRRLPSSTPVAGSADVCPAEAVPWQQLRTQYFGGARHFTVVTDDLLEQGRSRFSPFLAQRTPRDDYMITLSHALLGQIVAAGEAKGATVRLFYPYRQDLDDIFRELQCVQDKASGRYYPYDGSDFLRHLKKSPLAKRLLTVELVGSNFAISNDDWHLDVAGNQQAMRKLAAHLAGALVKMAKEKGPLTPPLDGR